MMFETSPDARTRRANLTAHELRGQMLASVLRALLGR